MEISDIQIINDYDKKCEVTFCDPDDDWNDCLKIVLSKNDMWSIHDFCQDKLSYAAELKKGKSK